MNLEPGDDGPTEAVRLGLQSGADAYDRFAANAYLHANPQRLWRKGEEARVALSCALQCLASGVSMEELERAVATLKAHFED